MKNKKEVSKFVLEFTTDEVQSLYLMLCVSSDAFRQLSEESMKLNDLENAKIYSERKKLAEILASLVNDLVKMNAIETMAHN